MILWSPDFTVVHSDSNTADDGKSYEVQGGALECITNVDGVR